MKPDAAAEGALVEDLHSSRAVLSFTKQQGAGDEIATLRCLHNSQISVLDERIESIPSDSEALPIGRRAALRLNWPKGDPFNEECGHSGADGREFRKVSEYRLADDRQFRDVTRVPETS